ncbi:hypothetical protein [Streptomyces sp. NPDC017949]|uniref:hypothetical protein n=1 Tax=Streptomyces sp. NPDC017949 TaxID=3365020 RepID=UPI0037A059D0
MSPSGARFNTPRRRFPEGQLEPQPPPPPQEDDDPPHEDDDDPQEDVEDPPDEPGSDEEPPHEWLAPAPPDAAHQLPDPSAPDRPCEDDREDDRAEYGRYAAARFAFETRIPTTAQAATTNTNTNTRTKTRTTVLASSRKPGPPGCGIPSSRVTGGMPPGRSRQSTLEQLQSFPAGWRP